MPGLEASQEFLLRQREILRNLAAIENSEVSTEEKESGEKGILYRQLKTITEQFLVFERPARQSATVGDSVRTSRIIRLSDVARDVKLVARDQNHDRW